MTTGETHSAIFLVVILAVATYAKFVLGYSAKEYFRLFFGEFRALLNADSKPAAINAFGVVVASFVLVANALMPQFTKLLTLASEPPSTGSDLGPAFAVASFIFLASFLCVHLIRPKG